MELACRCSFPQPLVFSTGYNSSIPTFQAPGKPYLIWSEWVCIFCGHRRSVCRNEPQSGGRVVLLVCPGQRNMEGLDLPGFRQTRVPGPCKVLRKLSWSNRKGHMEEGPGESARSEGISPADSAVSELLVQSTRNPTSVLLTHFCWDAGL